MNQRLKTFIQLVVVVIVAGFLTCNTDYGQALLEHGVNSFQAERNK